MEHLAFLFRPRSIAVVGVSRDASKLGSIIYHKLSAKKSSGTLRAEVYPVNPRIRELDGVKVYPRVSEIEGEVDMVVIAIPAESVVDVAWEAARKGAKVSVIVSGGFAEVGRKDLEDELRRIVEETGMRILGPNTLGVIDTLSGVDTFFLPSRKPLSDGRMAESLSDVSAGNVAVISQSGALSEVLMDCLWAGGVGIRAVVCVGNQVDLSTEDFIRYFAEDEATRVIAIYLEGVRDGRKLLNALLEASRRKPVVVIKAGKTEVAGKAAYTHTASMVGDIMVYRGAFKQAGVIEVEDMEEMADVVKAFSMMRPVNGNKLFVLTNAGGLAVLSSDLAIKYGLSLPDLPEGVRRELEESRARGVIPQIASIQNPMDLTAQGTSETFEQVFRTVALSGYYDLFLVMPTHQPPALDDTVIHRVSKIAREHGIPMVACEHGETEWSRIIREGFDRLGIPSYPDVRRAVRALSALASYRRPTSRPVNYPYPEDRLEWVGRLPNGPLQAEQASRILEEYGIETPRTLRILEEQELEEAFERISPPIVLKIVSRRITHKTDVGGVVVGLRSVEEALSSYRALRRKVEELGLEWEGLLLQEMVRGVELIFGSSWDKIFGPVVSVGIGGVFTEILKDISVRVAPVDPEQAEEMLGELKMRKIIDGYRGLPKVDVKVLAEKISTFSRIIFENPSIKQFEINPVIAAGDRLVAVDARGLIQR